MNAEEKQNLENDEWISGNLKLNLFGAPIDIEMTVPAKPVKLRRMLPIFQSLTNFVVESSASLAEEQGEKISCAAGCGACCRQVVPITEAEIYQLQELVENLPEPRRTEVRLRFARACERLHETKWLERMQEFLQYTAGDRLELATEYFSEQIACPFLENESCSIHPDRPLVCREYLVASPPENCSAPTAETIAKLQIPVQISTKVAKMDFYSERTKTPFIPMIQALEWAEARPETEVKKTGPEWMNQLFALLGK